LDVFEPPVDESRTPFDGSEPKDDVASTKTDESVALKRRSRSKKTRWVRMAALSQVKRVALQAPIVVLEDFHDESVNQPVESVDSHVEWVDSHVESANRNALLEDAKVLFRRPRGRSCSWSVVTRRYFPFEYSWTATSPAPWSA
jgi:hypothetical protein